MLENILTRKGLSSKIKITLKTIISAGIIALAVILPQLVHITLGASGGMQWLPMYLPILIGGCILGIKWGVCISIAAPLFSFLLTSLAGNPMPSVTRLPFMIAELAVFALVSGAFSKKIDENSFVAFPAVLFAAVSGRIFFLLLSVIFQSVSSLDVATVWTQIQTGFAGLLLQIVLIPLIIIGLKHFMNKDKNND